MGNLELNKILNLYNNNKLSLDEVIGLFITILDEVDNIKKRLTAIEGLERLNSGEEKIYKIFENLLISDNNPIIRAKAAKAIIRNFLNKGLEVLKWVFQHERSIDVLIGIETCLNKGKNSIKISLLLDLYQNLTKIYGLDINEVKFVLDFEWILGKSNEIGFFHPYIKRNHIISLQLGGYDISEIPYSIGMLKNLEYLNLWNNKLITLPKSFENLSSLEQLYLDWNWFQKIPNISWRRLISLRKLSITNNFSLNSLSDSIFNLAKQNFACKYIKEGVESKQASTLALFEFLTGQKLKKIEDKSDLNKFYACNYKINEKGSVIGIFLYGYHSFQINFIPKQILNFSNLEELVLRDQNLQFIPNWINNLNYLEKLDLMNNKICYIPLEINNLNHLISLDLEGNNIENVQNIISKSSIDIWI